MKQHENMSNIEKHKVAQQRPQTIEQLKSSKVMETSGNHAPVSIYLEYFVGIQFRMSV